MLIHFQSCHTHSPYLPLQYIEGLTGERYPLCSEFPSYLKGGTWNRLTDLRVQGGGGDSKRLAKEHISIYSQSMDLNNNLVEAEKGVRAGWRGK